MAVLTPGIISGGTIGVEATKALDGTTTSVEWAIPPRIGQVSIGVTLGGAGSYKVEYTNSPTADVLGGTARWFDAFGADQSTSRLITLYACMSSVRITRLTGSMTVDMRGQ
jgi:hypothetical protein